MGGFRALLIGIAEYTDSGVPPLPFVADGVGAVGAALESRGFILEEDTGASGWVGRTDLMRRVKNFILSAKRGDTLLVFLSGHGAHSDDIDYLLPSDFSRDLDRLADVAVPLNFWAAQLENTQAAGVVFLVDACREGFDEQVMGAVARQGWSESKGLAVANRKIAFVFACAPGLVARYVTGDQEFSLFGEAVRRVVEDPEGPSTLAELQRELDRAMREIAADNSKEAQEIRVRTEADRDAFVVLPPGRRSADRESWRRVAADHSAWDCVVGGEDMPRLRDLTDRLVASLAESHQRDGRARDADPWHDTSLAKRISGQASFLLRQVLGKPDLSAAEAALLVSAPFAYASYWSAESVRLSPVSPAVLEARPGADDERGSFERFARGYPRLLRRGLAVQQAGGDAASQIGWWIFHRWLARRPESYSPARLQPLLDAVMLDSALGGEVWTGQRMTELLRCFGADPGFLSRTDRPTRLRDRQPIAVGTADEQVVRERLIGYVLAIAHRMAIEPGLLPDIIAEHLGISDPVSVPGLLLTVAGARWEPRGKSRVLNAECGHPAMEVALRQHAHDLDALLGDAHRLAASEVDLVPLGTLPTHAAADLVGPGETADGPAYASAGIRFGLDEERVQELLMGEQLYGDRGLAVRELYQNALDACRYRQARTEYLRRAKGVPSDWHGRVRFQQGVDEHGRPYIDCTDNGIGMGIQELSGVFAQAGTKFRDMPEFLEEQAEWAALRPPVLMYPNSRFGIGVLSYFMLADEITLDTCRLGRDGRPGQRYRVSIAGPGNLFRINPLGPGTEADVGTTVRLRLRTDQDAVSCAGVLRDVLWVAEFETSVTDHGESLTWAPGELAAGAAAYGADAYLLDDPLPPVACPGTPVWWCPGPGRILADGIATDKQVFGAVVNLTGPSTPPLSVDRKTVLGERPAAVEQLLAAAVPDLFTAGPELVTWGWLARFGEDVPGVADLITEEVVRAGVRWNMEEGEYDAGPAGCWVWDKALVSLIGSVGLHFGSALRITGYNLPDWITGWRANALGLAASTGQPDAGQDHPVVPARPSDLVLLSYKLGLANSWLDPARPVPLGHLIRAAVKLGRPVQQVAARLTELGYLAPDVSGAPADLGDVDAILVDQGLGGQPGYRPEWFDRDDEASWLGQSPNWLDRMDYYAMRPHYLDEGEIVPLGHVISAAVRLRSSAGEVAKRLRALGYRVADVTGVPDDLTADDAAVMRANPDVLVHPGDREPPRYLDPAHPITIGKLLDSAVRMRRSPGQVAVRLAALGFRVPDTAGFPDVITEDDVDLVTCWRGGKWDWLVADAPVPASHVLNEAGRRNASVASIANRLSALGFTVPDLSFVPDGELSDEAAAVVGELVFVDQQADQEDAALESPRVLPPGLAVRIAARLNRDHSWIAARLSEFGYAWTPVADLAPDPGDARLMSLDDDGTSPWLPADLPVPLAHIVRTAVAQGRGTQHVADRLTLLGYQVPAVRALPADASETDIDLLWHANLLVGERHRLRAAFPDEPDAVVVHGRLISAARMLERGVGDVTRRLAQLGFPVPDMDGVREWVTDDDVTLVRMDIDDSWRDPAVPVPLGDVISLARQINREPADVADRFKGLGYQVADLSLLWPTDAALIPAEATVRGVGTQYLVALQDVVRVALTVHRPIGEVAERLRVLGFQLPDVTELLARTRPGG